MKIQHVKLMVTLTVLACLIATRIQLQPQGGVGALQIDDMYFVRGQQHMILLNFYYQRTPTMQPSKHHAQKIQHRHYTKHLNNLIF